MLEPNNDKLEDFFRQAADMCSKEKVEKTGIQAWCKDNPFLNCKKDKN